MKSNNTSVDIIDTPVFRRCSEREARFLRDLMRGLTPKALASSQRPDVDAIFDAVQDMTSGDYGQPLRYISPFLTHYLAYFAQITNALTREELDESPSFETHELLTGLMETVSDAIRANMVRRTDEGVFIDSFQIPDWFYDEETSRRFKPHATQTFSKKGNNSS